MLGTVGIDELCDVGSDVVTKDEVYGYCLGSRVSAGHLGRIESWVTESIRLQLVADRT